MQAAKFGMELGSFNVALTAQKHLILGSKGTLKLSLLKKLGVGALAGDFQLTIHHAGGLIFEGPIKAMMAGHEKEPEPFLVLSCFDPESVADALRPYEGKHVSIAFTPLA